MKDLFVNPLRRRSIFLAICVVMTVAFAGTPAEAQVPKARVQLYCKLVPDSENTGYKNWAVELKSSSGEVLSRSTKATGDTVKLKRLTPAIYQLCVSGEKGRSRCESVDLYLPPGEKTRRFTKDFLLPKTVLNNPDAHKISSVRLAVPSSAKRELFRSQESRIRGDRTGALIHLEKALAICPEYPEALNNMGTYYHRSGNYQKAIQLFRKVTQIDPDFFVGWLNLGGSLLARGELQQALDAQLRALALHPNDATVNGLTAMSYFRLRRLDEARERFMRVAELDPASSSLPHFYLAMIAMSQNEMAEAKKYICKYLEIHPNSPRAPYLRRTLDNIAASAMFRRASTLDGPPR
jgi:tetratricopeptide (TPR) repeat protein